MRLARAVGVPKMSDQLGTGANIALGVLIYAPVPPLWCGHGNRDGGDQCLAKASLMQFLTALCCAHHDISLNRARSLISARQVAVAFCTAALSGSSAALADMGVKTISYTSSTRNCDSN